MIRPGRLDDLDALVALEGAAFPGDRMSRRSLRYMLTRAHASLLVDEEDGATRGYVLVLFNRATALARVYSIAVSDAARGKGVGKALLAAAEAAAADHDCVAVRSEVRIDNEASQGLFTAAGYRQFERVEDYYEDHAAALRYERQLHPPRDLIQRAIPFYEQTLDFTCGSAALMMAMKSLRPALRMSRKLELRIWREATSIFMTSGHGGCGPYGLALAALRRGFSAEVYVKDRGAFLVDSVRDDEKRKVMRLVEEDFLEELAALSVPIHRRVLSFGELRERFDAGGVPLVLISSYRLYGERVPHWVVISGLDEHVIYLNDPFVDREEGESPGDSVNVPIARWEFERMARYGKSGQRAVVVVMPQPSPAT